MLSSQLVVRWLAGKASFSWGIRVGSSLGPSLPHRICTFCMFQIGADGQQTFLCRIQLHPSPSMVHDTYTGRFQ